MAMLLPARFPEAAPAAQGLELLLVPAALAPGQAGGWAEPAARGGLVNQTFFFLLLAMLA